LEVRVLHGPLTKPRCGGVFFCSDALTARIGAMVPTQSAATLHGLDFGDAGVKDSPGPQAATGPRLATNEGESE